MPIDHTPRPYIKLILKLSSKVLLFSNKRRKRDKEIRVKINKLKGENPRENNRPEKKAATYLDM